MATLEITNALEQTVAIDSNVLFSDTVIESGSCIRHRKGSGLVALKGQTANQHCARYSVEFGGNIAVPTGGTPGAISLGIAIEGEELASTEMFVVPSAVNNYFNVFSRTLIDVPKGCCVNVSIENTSTEPILVRNANMIVTRIA